MDLKKRCIICGIKSNELKDHMCPICKHLADEEFYQLKSYGQVINYFKNYLGKDPTPIERVHAKNLFKKFPKGEWIHGIMPSKCPICGNLSTNRGIIQPLKINTPIYKKIIVNHQTPELVCKSCGDLSRYLCYVYDFSREQAYETLEKIKSIVQKIKKEDLIACKECAKSLGNKKDYLNSLSKEDQEFLSHNKHKYLCETCLKKLKKNGK